MAITRTYVVGQKGTVYRRDNHAGPWTDVSIPVGQKGQMNILDVMSDPIDPDKVLVVGTKHNDSFVNGIGYSTNAGSSWIKPGGNWELGGGFSAKSWYEVWFVDSDVIWACGDNGRVAKSTDGGLTFNLTTIFKSFGYITAIHAISDQVAIVLVSDRDLTSNTNCEVWKTIDGGFSWIQLNGATSLTGIVENIGVGEGIWMSDDQSTIIATTSGTQNVSTDFGATFTSVTPEQTNGSGIHLTWYPSYGDPNFFRHVGGPILNVTTSTDTGDTFSDLRSNEELTIHGAHFYSDYNGYYIQQRTVYATDNGAVTGSLIFTVPGVERMNSIWTGKSPVIYRLVDCLGSHADIYSDTSILEPLVGLVVTLQSDGLPADVCWTVENTDLTEAPTVFIQAATEYATCEDCLPSSPDDICWDLISCNGECDDLLSVSGLPFIEPVTPGSLYTINQDPSCQYEVYPVRQAMYINLQSSGLSDPTSDFRAGTEEFIISCGSLIYNGVEQVTTPFTYTLSIANYQVVECTGLNCVSVPINTTENCIENIPIFVNEICTALGIPLEAYADDPEHCGFGCGGPDSGAKEGTCREMFRIQYRDGDTFTIEFGITSTSNPSNSSLGSFELSPGNLAIQNDITDQQSAEVCSSNVYCPPVEQPITITSIEPWDGPCTPEPEPTDPEGNVLPQLGEACVITPRLGEPGFTTKHCDPKKVVAIKTKFAESVYALFKRMRYGIETCCEFDLDKIDVKNMLLDLGDIYDPDLCVPGQPVPNGCCPQPCNSMATLIVPLTSTCPVPTNTVAVLALAPQSCEAPSGAVADLVIP